ncbi:hypothetical protein CLG96_09925 [Sphingomonas oleivorans]|uniref:Lysophospholipase n=1 Tax=Sphingomonas oleivorans TaxID=1735121 RepID=A0A2T5FXW3_9SPHN|nr:DUF1489 domain-containing protein [Sphingomonas oleivorans]PTQ10973.1 hypothetical protein CLG96_09925 [Sphingomonas oleivorans]
MHPLHITKVAVGCADVDALRARIEGRSVNGEAPVHTRYKPKRADELIGGSLYWIIKHRLVVRQRIIGFAEDEGGHCIIRLESRLMPVRARPKRAHQGWRYLKGEDAPADLDGGEDDLSVMPPRLISELSALALI